MSVKPYFNRETGKYEVKMHGTIHEFDDWDSAWDYINSVMDDRLEN